MTMRAMILTAGRGNRLRPLTDNIPKPLLSVGDEALVVRHVRRLTAAGFAPIVINLWHLGEQIVEALGDGSTFGTSIQYSWEALPLAAAGGIRQAMSKNLLDEPFVLVNGDIYCDYDLRHFHAAPRNGVHLLLVDNPPAKPSGDFSLADNQLCHPAEQTYTYAGMGVFQPSLFTDLVAGQSHELLPILQQAIDDNKATAYHYQGCWHDIGTPSALAAARSAVSSSSSS